MLLRERHESRYIIEGDYYTSCWVWVQCLTRPTIRLDGKTVNAHRAFYEEEHGKIQEGLVLDHVCNNGKCVNPWHLDEVTQKVNMRRHYFRLNPHRCVRSLNSVPAL